MSDWTEVAVSLFTGGKIGNVKIPGANQGMAMGHLISIGCVV